MKRLNVEQGSIEWFDARCGIVTASRLVDAMATLKNGAASKQCMDYVLELVTERLTGQAYMHFANAAMTHGTQFEPIAREAYEAETGALVDKVGFCRHDILPFGASPDGLIGDDGAIEIKCPYDPRVSIRTRIEGMPPEHMPQVQGVLYVTGRSWCDFVSYDPRLPPKMQLYVQRIDANAEWCERIVVAIDAIDVKINQIMEKLNG